MKKAKLSVLLLFLSIFISACNSDSNDSAESGENLSGEIIKEISRTVVNSSSLKDANTKFNSDLYEGLKTDNENLFYSSYSIFSALSMTYAGAMNETKKEFEKVLYYGENLSVHESFASLTSQSSYQYNSFNIANSIWPQKDYPFKEDFIYTVVRAYESEVNYQDYINSFEEARVTINDWVEDKTQDKILKLIPQGSLDESTKLVLVNALYFKGLWQKEFKTEDTDKQSFNLYDTTSKDVDMMHITDEFKYYEDSYFKMIELPYKENEFSMLVFLPNSYEDMTKLEEELFKSSSALKLRDNLMTQNVELSFPKFKIKWGTKSIKNFLISKGMSDIFDPSLADLTAMWTRQSDENLYLTDVLHQAFIEVDEEGTEAAAATAVIVGVTSVMPLPLVKFNAEHPFIFFIVDNSSGMIMFSGKLEDPSVE